MEEYTIQGEEKLQQLHSENATQQEVRVQKCESKESLVPYRIRTFNSISKETKALPPGIKLFGDLIYKNEIAILAGDTGVGKSLLAVDLAISIARGTSKNEHFQNQSEPLTVVYFDYELSDVQFYKRFHGEDYPDTLLRVDGNPDCLGCGINLEHIKEVVLKSNASFVVIDNLSAYMMDSGRDPEVALKLMADLRRLQRELNITFLVLAHTPKRYENTPLKVEHVAGSKLITNFADSIWFIAKSTKGKSTRYIKQVKQRNTEEIDGVYQMEIKSNDEGVYFDFVDINSEREHLYENTQALQSTRNSDMKALVEQGKSQTEVAAIFGVDKATVCRAVNPKGK